MFFVYDVTKFLRGLGDKGEVDGIEDERMRREARRRPRLEKLSHEYVIRHYLENL